MSKSKKKKNNKYKTCLFCKDRLIISGSSLVYGNIYECIFCKRKYINDPSYGEYIYSNNKIQYYNLSPGKNDIYKCPKCGGIISSNKNIRCGKCGYFIRDLSLKTSIKKYNKSSTNKKYVQDKHVIAYSYTEPVIKKDIDAKILKAADFLVRTTNYQCTNKNHTLIRINAVVRVMGRGSVIEVEAPAYYCKKCDRYYVLESNYEQIKSYGYICCRIDTFEALVNPNKGPFQHLNEQSILMNYGYRVDKRTGLSDEQRQLILSFLIDNEIISKNKIIDYLKFFISLNKNKKLNENAVQKWKKDIVFVHKHEKVEGNVYANSFRVPLRRVKLNDYEQSSIEDYI